ncbi:hypothetical protein B0O99DRAFT_692273 [Bisporella sp. PMI_857]|nr:hypothetical protein B0O99DRAFT_692273 [Bisporella sp. PMI_857]
MNPSIRKRAVLLGVAALGLLVTDRVTRSKNNTVAMGINGQLNDMNAVADFGREYSGNAWREKPDDVTGGKP